MRLFASSSLLAVAVAVATLATAAPAQAGSAACQGHGAGLIPRSGASAMVWFVCSSAVGAPITVDIVAQPTHATVTPLSTTSFRVAAEAGYVGADSFTIRPQAADGAGPDQVIPLDIKAVDYNEPPSCTVRPLQSAMSGLPHLLGLECSDPNDDAYAIAVVSGPAHGTAVGAPLEVDRIISAPRPVEYTSAPGYVGPETLTVQARDDRGGLSAPYVLSFNVDPGPPAPPAIESTPIPSNIPEPDVGSGSAPSPRLRLGKLPRLKTALKRGLRVRIATAAPGTARLTVTLDGRSARRLKLSSRGRTVTVASARATVRANGSTTFTARFTRAARKALARTKRVTLLMRVRDRTGMTVTRTIRLRR